MGSLGHAKAAARVLMTDLLSDAFTKAEESGFMPDDNSSDEENAVALIKAGLPLAFMEPRWSELLS